jgi:hypothetical protein
VLIDLKMFRTALYEHNKEQTKTKKTAVFSIFEIPKYCFQYPIVSYTAVDPRSTFKRLSNDQEAQQKS